ncbi:hypothetical protein [Flavobacterium sp.]|uniref:hypothetical protein n=1 Tax=Flavobacterium sp. TaxID=239 RepID=UPI0031DF258C
MKLKITLLIFFCLLFVKVHGQASINETKRQGIISDSLRFKEILQATVAKIKLEETESILKEKEDAITKDGKDSIRIKEIKDSIAANKKELKSAEVALALSEKEKEQIVYIEFYQKKIEGLKKENEESEKKLKNQTEIKKIDSIKNLIKFNKRQIKIQEVERDKKILSLNTYKCWWPTMRKFDREIFFHDMYSNTTNKTIFLNALSLNANSNAAAVQTEVVTDNLSALRLSFGSVMSLASSDDDKEGNEEEKEETEQEAFSRLINGGGNFYLEAILPIVCTNPNNGNQFTFYTYASLRGAMDIEGFGNNIDTSTANYTGGLFMYFGLSSDSKKFNFFVQPNVNVTGGTNDFYKNLGLIHEKAFLNGKIVAGVTILNNFRFSATLATFGSDAAIRSSKITAGIQILPGL